MCNQTTLNKILKEIRKVYEKVYGDKLVKVVLYGSYARGDYDNESDIDIVGIVDENRIDTQFKIKKIGKVASDLGMKNDIYIFNRHTL
jgi:Predicted nucleotidyltransferases